MTPRCRAAAALAAVAVLAGCASDRTAGTSGPATRPPATTAVGSSTTTTTPAPASTATSPPQPIGSTTAPTAQPSPTGVPGIDATDEFCAAWARYAGTLQIIAVAVNFGDLDAISAARLELQAAPTIVIAVTEIEADWPGELAAERQTAIDEYLGPYGRRAGKALSALSDAGVDAAGQARLADAWAQVLAARNPDEPTVTVELADELAAEVDAGAAAFDAAVTPWGSDPSLTADLDRIPLTKAYLAANCPDLASIGIGDDV